MTILFSTSKFYTKNCNFKSSFPKKLLILFSIAKFKPIQSKFIYIYI